MALPDANAGVLALVLVLEEAVRSAVEMELCFVADRCALPAAFRNDTPQPAKKSLSPSESVVRYFSLRFFASGASA